MLGISGKRGIRGLFSGGLPSGMGQGGMWATVNDCTRAVIEQCLGFPAP